MIKSLWQWIIWLYNTVMLLAFMMFFTGNSSNIVSKNINNYETLASAVNVSFLETYPYENALCYKRDKNLLFLPEIHYRTLDSVKFSCSVFFNKDITSTIHTHTFDNCEDSFICIPSEQDFLTVRDTFDFVFCGCEKGVTKGIKYWTENEERFALEIYKIGETFLNK